MAWRIQDERAVKFDFHTGRNVRHCRSTVLKDKTVAEDGCIVVHAHDFEPELLQ